MLRLIGLVALASLVSCAGCPSREDNATQVSETLPLGAVTITTGDGRQIDYTVEVADSDPERTQGLMYRKSLAPQSGMLFLFDREAHQAFWMKNTYISLDILFITADWRIVGIVPHAKPLESKLLYVRSPSRYVLEIAAGESEKWGFSQGDEVNFRPSP